MMLHQQASRYSHQPQGPSHSVPMSPPPRYQNLVHPAPQTQSAAASSSASPDKVAGNSGNGTGPGQQQPSPGPALVLSASASSILNSQSSSTSSSSDTTTTNSANHNNHNNNQLKSSNHHQQSHSSQQQASSSSTQSVNGSSPPAPTTSSPVAFGELIILGYNGSLPQGEKGRRRSKYQLVRRLTPNGIKKSKHYSVKQPQSSKAIQDKEQHSISFTLSRSQAIIVEYQHDEETDMFQIGRSSESPIDFVVIDTLMFDPNKSHHHSSSSSHSHHNNNNSQQPHPPGSHPSAPSLLPPTSHQATSTHPPIPFPPCLSEPAILLNNSHNQTQQQSSMLAALVPKVVQQSTISRFACRILVDRKPPYCARIYAAGFDSSKNIFLGEKATKWQTNGEIDGLTTNGILIMHPKRAFIGKRSLLEELGGGGGSGSVEEVVSSPEADSESSSTTSNIENNSTVMGGGGSCGGVWREVSVCGEIYSVRETRSASQKGVKIDNETNVLQDGTLIDLCGATLMWRSAEGLARSPTKRLLEEMIDQLNASRPQCPVGLNTLVIPRKSASLGAADDKQPYVYLNCGHVQGYHDWGQSKHSNARTCPMCFKSGPIVRLAMGIEPSFCTNAGTPGFGFNPCGHMASEATVKYWSQVLIPHGTNGFHAMCPFCATPLQGDLGYVKLIFQ